MRRRVACGLWLALGIAPRLVAGAPVEINTASVAQLEALGGIGTALAARVVEERAHRPFTDWTDAKKRLKGLGPKLAAQLSDQGLTVNGAAYAPPAPRPGSR